MSKQSSSGFFKSTQLTKAHAIKERLIDSKREKPVQIVSGRDMFWQIFKGKWAKARYHQQVVPGTRQFTDAALRYFRSEKIEPSATSLWRLMCNVDGQLYVSKTESPELYAIIKDKFDSAYEDYKSLTVTSSFAFQEWQKACDHFGLKYVRKDDSMYEVVKQHYADRMEQLAKESKGPETTSDADTEDGDDDEEKVTLL